MKKADILFVRGCAYHFAECDLVGVFLFVVAFIYVNGYTLMTQQKSMSNNSLSDY